MNRRRFRQCFRKEQIMPARFAATANAFEKGIESTPPASAVKLIEGWEEALSKVDLPGTKGIERDLGALKKALDTEEPDGERVRTLLGKLSEEVTRIAARTDGAVQPKLEDLGEALKAA
ncbi:hypothetical protein [Glacieibacterium frigidum]|uniref:hypothetical protein n=1 Tax=Glacieibacterium frigidum TaxID=2593303 RepID=UPI001182886C|nr:hypothetical protein [Glacieibacterium frigidum]